MLFRSRPSVCTRTEQLLHGGFLASVERRRDEELSSPAMFIKVCSYSVEFSPHTGIPLALGCCFTLVHELANFSTAALSTVDARLKLVYSDGPSNGSKSYVFLSFSATGRV